VTGAGMNLRSRERGRCRRRRQENQRLEEHHILMCKACGKKCLNALYLCNSFTKLNLRIKAIEKSIVIPIGYAFVVFRYGDTTSCGSKGNFWVFNVHNLFTDYLF
jgi:hypothetical protein